MANVASIQAERDKYQDACGQLEREAEMDARTIKALQANLSQVVTELQALRDEHDRLASKYSRARTYHVVAINARHGWKTTLTAYPLLHDRACTNLRALTTYTGRHLQLEECSMQQHLDGLKLRSADALGWSLQDVNSLSLPALREVLRPVSVKLAHEVTCAMQSPAYFSR